MKTSSAMKMLQTTLCAVAVALLTPAASFAQSSGNFTYSSDANSVTACTLDYSNGSITGGEQCQASCTIDATTCQSVCTPQSGDCGGHAAAGIKTSSGQGNV